MPAWHASRPLNSAGLAVLNHASQKAQKSAFATSNCAKSMYTPLNPGGWTPGSAFMPLRDFLLRLIGITRTIQSWHAALLCLDASRREKLAAYADEIAATFARAALAFTILDRTPADARARRDAVRELGRISGYLDDLVRVLESALDGRKLSGLKRRLTRLGPPPRPEPRSKCPHPRQPAPRCPPRRRRLLPRPRRRPQSVTKASIPRPKLS